MRWLAWSMLSGVLTGCTFPELPVIEVDAAVDAIPVDAPPCTADTAVCVGDVSRVCDATGQQLPDEMCWLGCREATGRCERLQTSNALDGYLDLGQAANDVDLRPSAVVDVDTGVITVRGAPITVDTALVPAANDAPATRVFYARSFQIGDVTVIGIAPPFGLGNALAFVAPGAIVVSGVVDVSADGTVNGPGVTVGHGGQGTTSIGDFRGAGGGGFGSDGGAGGLSTMAGQNSSPLLGAPAFGSMTLEPLRGGSWGGVNQDTFIGGAGGAVQLSSETSVSINAGAGIDAGGGGAPTGGGGSGGGILLEAPTVIVNDAFVVANGGGGGNRCSGPERGEDGRRDTVAATGRAACTGIGTGGRGSVVPSQSPGNGAAAPMGGSGGGGVGRIVVRTTTGSFSPVNGSIVSPPADTALTRIRP